MPVEDEQPADGDKGDPRDRPGSRSGPRSAHLGAKAHRHLVPRRGGKGGQQLAEPAGLLARPNREGSRHKVGHRVADLAGERSKGPLGRLSGAKAAGERPDLSSDGAGCSRGHGSDGAGDADSGSSCVAELLGESCDRLDSHLGPFLFAPAGDKARERGAEERP